MSEIMPPPYMPTKEAITPTTRLRLAAAKVVEAYSPADGDAPNPELAAAIDDLGEALGELGEIATTAKIAALR